MDYTKRKEEIKRLRNEGKTYKEIGSMFGISISRARDIYRKTLREEERAEEYKLMGRLPVRYFLALKRAGVDSDEKLIEMIEAGYNFYRIRKLGKNANHVINFYYGQYLKEKKNEEK